MNMYGPDLPPGHVEGAQSEHGPVHGPIHGSEHGSDLSDSDQVSYQSMWSKQLYSVRPKKHLDKRKHKTRAKYVPQSSSSEETDSSVQVKKSAQPKGLLLSKNKPKLIQPSLLWRSRHV